MERSAAAAPGARRPVRWAGWLLVLAAGLLINVFLVTTVGISGSSMEPSLTGGERALVPRYELWLNRLTGRDYRRGDIVFFPDPTARDCSWRCPYLIKRVVGLPGETVEIRSGQVLIDSLPLQEPYLQDAWQGSFSLQPVTVPAGSYFVLGDNRYPYGSQDSRSFGPVAADAVAGRASFVLWPPLRSGNSGLQLNLRGL